MAAGQAAHAPSAAPITDRAEVEKMAEAVRARYGTTNVQTCYPAANAAIEDPAARPTREPST